MQFSFSIEGNSKKSKKTAGSTKSAMDLIVVPFIKKGKSIHAASRYELPCKSSIEMALATGDFKCKEGETLLLYVDEPHFEKRVLLLGLGDEEKLTQEKMRRNYSSVVKLAIQRGWEKLAIVLPDVKGGDFFKSICEGLLLTNYIFEKYKTTSNNENGNGVDKTLVKHLHFIGGDETHKEIAHECAIVAKAVHFARDLVNGNADEVTPQYLEQCAKEIAKEHSSVRTSLFTKKQIEKEGLSLLLAVNRGSHRDPAFIIMEYKGAPKSKEHLVLVGKGVTYDTGGLNIKPTGSMEQMKCDMGGAATCFGTILAASQLKLKVNLTVVVPATENGIDAQSFKPGDVYQSYLGKTVEMTNSDAEGRLILADALAYSVKKLKPTYLVDFATLTGAIDVALGPEATGVMCNHVDLMNKIKMVGDETFERVWEMPLYEEYKERLKSDIADLKSWNGRAAASSVAAIFLQEFTGDIPWAHFDIASTAFLNEGKYYLPKYGTGVGVRFMIELLRQIFRG